MNSDANSRKLCGIVSMAKSFATAIQAITNRAKETERTMPLRFRETLDSFPVLRH